MNTLFGGVRISPAQPNPVVATAHNTPTSRRVTRSITRALLYAKDPGHSNASPPTSTSDGSGAGPSSSTSGSRTLHDSDAENTDTLAQSASRTQSRSHIGAISEQTDGPIITSNGPHDIAAPAPVNPIHYHFHEDQIKVHFYIVSFQFISSFLTHCLSFFSVYWRAPTSFHSRGQEKWSPLAYGSH
jgi:hypothetical protein